MKNTTFIVTAFLLALLVVPVFAQAKDKQQKPLNVPAQTPKNDQEKITLRGIVLGTDWTDMTATMGVAEDIRTACHFELIHAVKELEIRDTQDLSRSDAIKMAKKEEDFFVVTLELQTLGSRYDVRFTVYEPKTAKTIGTGSAFLYKDTNGQVAHASHQRAGQSLARQILDRIGLRALIPKN